MPSLRREEVVTIEVLSAKQLPARAIAGQLGVAESTVRYNLQRSRDGAVDGRKGMPFAADRCRVDTLVRGRSGRSNSDLKHPQISLEYLMRAPV